MERAHLSDGRVLFVMDFGSAVTLRADPPKRVNSVSLDER
jgi:hypothetical protein